MWVWYQECMLVFAGQNKTKQKNTKGKQKKTQTKKPHHKQPYNYSLL